MKIPKTPLVAFFLLMATFAAAEEVETPPEPTIFGNLFEMNDENFASTLEASDPEAIWVVTFYVPWCEHAKAYSPQLEDAASKLALAGYKIRFGAVDVSANPKVGWMYQIDNSPLVKVFTHDGVEFTHEAFEGDRSSKAMEDHCVDLYKRSNVAYSNMPVGFSDGDLIELDDRNFDDIVLSSNEIWLIKFGAPWCYHCNLMKPSWVAAAKELGARVRFGIVNADANRGLAKRFGVKKLPTLKFFYAGYGKTDEMAETYSAGRSQTEILAFSNKLWDEFSSDPSKYHYSAASEASTESTGCPLSLEDPSSSGCAISNAEESSCSSGCSIEEPAAESSCSSGCAISEPKPTVAAQAPESHSANDISDALNGVCA